MYSFILYIVVILKDTELLLDASIGRIHLCSFLKKKYMYLLGFLVQRSKLFNLEFTDVDPMVPINTRYHLVEHMIVLYVELISGT